MTSKTQQTDI